jgi:type I restriction enzyme, R subunit
MTVLPWRRRQIPAGQNDARHCSRGCWTRAKDDPRLAATTPRASPTQSRSSIRDIVEQKLAQMLARNPMRMDYQRKYEEIVAGYNQEKDRATIEETSQQLVELVKSLDEEQRPAPREGLREDELALFDLLQKEDLDKRSRERVKQASRELIASIKTRLAELNHFWEKDQTKANIEVFILDNVYVSLPTPPFTSDEKKVVAQNVYAHVWRQAMNRDFASLYEGGPWKG